ncbi:hypothetical protein [Methylobacterium isbiliense]|jgi:hypothetical protein|uniref:Uncharacterized protein n=1 Tax=Methylobacterium isbiliense TaxID=315478 RepID=A0ABQ4SQ82_9HYPH|nr:hypothetical protein [Methylobacterium isbiliense]MDN3627235.1 hypothetical protein [Methylobacterium isbiliense]GJE04025.1 hypothetical protein GMJLKIPL_5985 [Methylobacterium isbiliense]
MIPELARAIAVTAADVLGRRFALRGLDVTDEAIVDYVLEERGFRDQGAVTAIAILARHEIDRRHAEAVARHQRARPPRRRPALQDPARQLALGLDGVAA